MEPGRPQDFLSASPVRSILLPEATLRLRVTVAAQCLVPSLLRSRQTAIIRIWVVDIFPVRQANVPTMVGDPYGRIPAPQKSEA